MKTGIISSKSIAERADRFGLQKLGRRIRSFRKEKRGVAAVEFALIAPFMIALWLGSIELSQGVAIDRKVSLASNVVADLVTQQTNVTVDEMNDIMNATLAIMLPYDTSRLDIVVTGVEIDENGDTNEWWSASRAGPNATSGGAYTIPAALLLPDTFLIVAQLAYRHEPLTTQGLGGPITLKEVFFMRPRRSDTISYP